MSSFLRARATRFGFAVFLILPLALPAGAAATDHGKLTGGLAAELESVASDELVPVAIVLRDQLSGDRLTARVVGISDRRERRLALVEALKSHAERTQAPLRERLQEAARAGGADRIRAFWLGNIVAAELIPEIVREIAALPAVDHVQWTPKRPVFLDPPASFDASPPSPFDPFLPEETITEIECGVDLMQAPRVWSELGNTGDGAVVAVIDSGVCWYHPDIASQIWVNPGEDLDGDGVVMDADDENGVDDDGNGYVDDLIGYDIENRDNDPNDDNSHGSHCAGTVAGDGTGGTQAGMAPDARIMVLRVGLSTSDEPDVWEAMQYAAENGADAISMSLGWQHSWDPDRATWRNNCENTIELGTAMVIAAGNEGSGNEPDNIRTPGDVPRIISVAAVDCSDNIASFSSRGPVTWQDVPPWNDHPYPPGLTKPDVAAPGVSTKSHNVCDGYSFKSGTSMATPHVAGAVALMTSANPGLTHDDIKLILEDTAVDLGAAGKDNVYGSGRVDAYEAALRCQTSNGIMSVREAEVSCAGNLTLIVSDQDLQGAGTLDVEVVSDTETVPEIATLVETSASSGVFRGGIDADSGEPAADGRIQVSDGDLVTATYIDADDGQGGVNVPKTDDAAVDCRGPVISDVRATDITGTRAVIRWNTDETSDSRVTYGDQRPPGSSASSSGLVTSHAVTLTGLVECTVYYYEVASADSFGNGASDDNAGQHYRFETYGDFGQGLQPCHAGVVNVEAEVLSCSDVLPVRLVDIDLNLAAGEADLVEVGVSSLTETAPEPLVLIETGPNTSTFTGSIPIGPGTAAAGDGIVQVSPGDVVTATYHDDDDGTGAAAVSFDDAVVDCSGAVATEIRVLNATDETAQVRIVTAEPTTVMVEWGETAALGRQVSDAGLSTTHTLTLEPLEECGRFFFRVHSTDAYGNDATYDEAGVPFEFNAATIPGAVFRDGFESDAGWSLEGEWEVGAPQGLGASPGDPLAAYSGAGVLGHDLSGLGDWPGEYEPGSEESAVSPPIDASALGNVEMKFRRWLNVGAAGIAYIQVQTQQGWQTVWNSPSTSGFSESAWSLQTIDLTEYAAGDPSLQVRFLQKSGFQGSHAAGWNVDRFIVRDGSLPDFGACMDCGGGPGFAGVESAVDTNPCGAGGVRLTWSPPASWGTGQSGSYAVYRDIATGFTPSASNVVASGIAATEWIDDGAPAGAPLYYVVRAESDETCSDGPNNGGTTDDNLVYATVVDETAQTLPGGIGDTVSVDSINDAHVRVSWTPVPDAARYHVYRSDSPQGPFDLVADVTETHFDHIDEMGLARNGHYIVVAADACGNEGP